MPSLGKHKIRVGERDDYLQMDFIIYVNAEGLFTTLLSKELADTLEAANIELSYSRSKRDRKGYFESKTKEGLLLQIKKVGEEYCSREMVKEEIVLKYSIASYCSFGFTVDDKIIPNLAWHKDGKIDQHRDWQQGTVYTHAAKKRPTGVLFYVKPYWKRVYSYKSGKSKTEYTALSPFGGSEVKDDKRYYLKYLEAICSTSPPSDGRMKEIPYTEDRAKFFVNLFKQLCKLSHMIAQFEEPERMIELIESGNNLLSN